MQHFHFASVGQARRLLGSHNYVFVVWQHKHRLCRRGVNGVQNIICGGVHRLPAAYHNIRADIFKQFREPVAGTYSHKAVFVYRIGRNQCCLVIVFVFTDSLLRVSVLIAHIVNFNIDQLAIFQRRLDHIARLVGMHMYLDNVIVVHHNNAVADRFKKRPQFQRIFFFGIFRFFY